MPKISLSGPAQLLAVIPYHLGFRPDRSVVVVCFHDKRLGLMARLDAVGSEHTALAAASLLPTLVREAPTSVAIVGFELTAGETMPLSDALATAVVLERIPLRERLLVRDGRWFGLGCDCCPAEGSPMPADADVPALATYVGLGQAVLGTRAAMTRLIEPLAATAPRHDALARAISEWQEQYAWSVVTDVGDQLEALTGVGLEADASDGYGDAGRDDECGFDREDSFDCEDSFDGDALDDDGPPRAMLVEAALLCWRALLCDETSDSALQAMLPAIVGPLRFCDLRDAIIAWICPGTMTLDHVDPDLVESLRLCLGDDVRAPGPVPGPVSGPVSGQGPHRGPHQALRPPPGESLAPPSGRWLAVAGAHDDDEALAPRAIAARLERLCRATPTAHAAPVLSVFAAYAWWAGNGTKAGMAVDRALEIEGEHRLCGLIRTALDHGVRSPLPGWAA
ncbi:hypothetical protein BA895_15915 [Humibacillus sp. DSM 29435]|uniref:DUF4192 domain-containing protein n=1 Tax=Humibacillus sp. DSM 29435 TaxID=1869167 RepID=UPI000871B506|nr:DUF4192 domain-containing protein [Humibacillus sp. DSM 29435]OFE17484.1 hypothetical protein BA895_15915 [Humibacillus sp. DSM 29435]